MKRVKKTFQFFHLNYSKGLSNGYGILGYGYGILGYGILNEQMGDGV